MGLLGDRPEKLPYRGQTFRREVVRDISPYSGAWRNGNDNHTAGKDFTAGDVGTVTGKGRFRKSTYRSSRFKTNEVYGADDGSFLQNATVDGRNARRLGVDLDRLSVRHGEGGLDRRDTNAIVRYVEDPKGTFGVGEYNGRTPSKFINVSRLERITTSGKTNISDKPKGERNATSIAQSALKRKKSVGTSKFRIDIGGTTRTSGLGIPTV